MTSKTIPTNYNYIVYLKKLQQEILRVQSRDTPNKKFKMQLEALQSARNTLAIVAVLIASVTFTCGLNPPGEVYQGRYSIEKSTAEKTLAFMIFWTSNSITLFTSVSMVILFVTPLYLTGRTRF